MSSLDGSTRRCQQRTVPQSNNGLMAAIESVACLFASYHNEWRHQTKGAIHRFLRTTPTSSAKERQSTISTFFSGCRLQRGAQVVDHMDIIGPGGHNRKINVFLTASIQQTELTKNRIKRRRRTAEERAEQKSALPHISAKSRNSFWFFFSLFGCGRSMDAKPTTDRLAPRNQPANESARLMNAPGRRVHL